MYKENIWGGPTFLFGGKGVIKINFEPNAGLDPILELDEIAKLDKLNELS